MAENRKFLKITDYGIDEIPDALSDAGVKSPENVIQGASKFFSKRALKKLFMGMYKPKRGKVTRRRTDFIDDKGNPASIFTIGDHSNPENTVVYKRLSQEN